MAHGGSGPGGLAIGGSIVQFNILGFKEFDRDMGRMAEKVDDWKPAFRAIADGLSDITEDAFNTQGQRKGFGKWEPLSDAYEAWKETHFPGQPILQLTGKMKLSFTDSSHPDHIRDIDPLVMVWGSQAETDDGAPYPFFHNTGAGRLPERRIVHLALEEDNPDLENDSDTAPIMEVLNIHMRDVIADSGLGRPPVKKVGSVVFV